LRQKPGTRTFPLCEAGALGIDSYLGGVFFFHLTLCLSLFLLKEKVTKKFKEKANAPLPFPGQRHGSTLRLFSGS
jgi:hypothetical protein